MAIGIYRIYIISALRPGCGIDILSMLYDFFYIFVYIDDVFNYVRILNERDRDKKKMNISKKKPGVTRSQKWR